MGKLVISHLKIRLNPHGLSAEMNPLLPEIQIGPFINLENLLVLDDFITTDKFLNFAINQPNISYVKRDFFFKSGQFRGEDFSSLFSRRRDLRGKIIITGHSDIPTLRKQLYILQNIGIKSVFGTNTYPRETFSYSLPLGLTNNTNESDLHPIFGNVEHFRTANSTDFCSEFAPQVLANFSVRNNYKLRNNLLKGLALLSDKYEVVLQTPEMNSDGRIRYLRKLREIPLVVCPEGNGADTHRLWETLYMGGVPVVVNSPLLNSLFAQLPVIRLNNWGQLGDIDFIQNEWQKVRKVQWNPNLLSASHWKREIILRSS